MHRTRSVLHVWAANKNTDCVCTCTLSRKHFHYLLLLGVDVLHCAMLLLISCMYVRAITCCCSYSFVCFYYRLSCAASAYIGSSLHRDSAKMSAYHSRKERNIDFYRWILINSIVAFAWKRYKCRNWKKERKKLNEGFTKWTQQQNEPPNMRLLQWKYLISQHGVRFIISHFYNHIDLTADSNIAALDSWNSLIFMRLINTHNFYTLWNAFFRIRNSFDCHSSSSFLMRSMIN